ncbi:hypothetical protein D9M71_799590 [compost metagenome]
MIASSLGAIGGMIGRWKGPVADTTRRASITPSEVSMVKPGRSALRTTDFTSTPVRMGASNVLA